MCRYLKSVKTTQNPIGDPMRCFLFAVLSLAAPLGAFALTWDFADGSTYGWTARATTIYANAEGTNAPLHSEIVDGVWRMALVPDPSKVQLISPVIGEDSALFDRLTLRLRLIHHSPIEGFLWMNWSNVKYNRRTDFSVNRARFRTERPSILSHRMGRHHRRFTRLSRSSPRIGGHLAGYPL